MKKTIGEIIEQARLSKGLNRSELARKAGISVTQIKRIELDETQNVGIETLSDICRALNIPLEKLINADKPKVNLRAMSELLSLIPEMTVQERLQLMEHLVKSLKEP